jgi:hypothetical protein
MQGIKGLWVAWPSIKEGNLWVKNFEFVDKNLKRSVEGELIKNYIDISKSKGR